MAVNTLQNRPKSAAQGLRVSAYDRSSSLLIALLVIVGAAVLGIVIVFFSNRIQRTPPAIPVTPIAPPDTASGAEEDFSDTLPGVEDALLEEVEVESFLDALSEVASESLQIAEKAAAQASGARKGDPRGVGGSGSGRSNSKEPRREIRFQPESFNEYTKWFDEKGFELGVLGGEENLVHYASQMSKATPEVRTGNPDEEQRLYFNSGAGPLSALDRRLAQKAGILDKGKMLLLFCSPAVQQELLGLEAEAAGGKPKTDIAQTVFRVTKSGGRFGFEVESQDYYR